MPETDADILSRIFSSKKPDDYLNTINVGDSTEVLRKLPDKSIDMVVTSPPYNFSIDYDTISDDLDIEEYFNGLGVIWEECLRLLKDNGRIAVVIKPNYSKRIDSHHIIVNSLKSIGFLWRMEIVWETSHYNCPTTSWGSFRSPSDNYFRYTHEFIEVLDKRGRKRDADNYITANFPGKYRKDDLIDLTKEEFVEWTTGIWRISPEIVRRGHPAVFPEEIPTRLIKLNTYIGDVILDPFMGSGTTLKVADMLHRFSIGVDISEKYCDAALERVSRSHHRPSLVDVFEGIFPSYRKVKW